MKFDDKQLVSVVIPAYNVEKYIEECIESVCHQTYKNLNIVIIDDGSTDFTGKICDKMAETDSRIVVVHQANGGLSAARNVGIEKSNGDFICFIDGDDVLDLEFVERLLDAINKYNLDIAFCSYKRFWDNIVASDDEENAGFTEYTKDEMLSILSDVRNEDRELATIVCNKLYKKRIFEDLRFILGRIHEDEFIIHKLVGQCNKIGYVKFDGYYYRTRTDSITGSWKNYSLKHLDVIDAYANRLKYIKSIGNNALIKKMTFSMCEIVLMEYFSIWENGNLNAVVPDTGITIDKYLRKYMKGVVLERLAYLTPRLIHKYIYFTISPVSFYKKFWHRDISKKQIDQ
ncbi:glycosyltransferase family 2 protein [Butyrivibrio sp. ob235]|uniref:glycosyltransferase family 2 protein n=1 Tax=Butyrivibrio sp. ob235 TaxID=1761780 RepID=UPI000B813E05|nr:glycosyltransferase family 2 protein [Butyrivibrio sp. ob235]